MGHDNHDHHDDHGHDDHGHGDHHDDHGHDTAAHHGPDPYIVYPSSQAVAAKPNTGLAYFAFIALFLIVAVIVKLLA